MVSGGPICLGGQWKSRKRRIITWMWRDTFFFLGRGRNLGFFHLKKLMWRLIWRLPLLYECLSHLRLKKICGCSFQYQEKRTNSHLQLKRFKRFTPALGLRVAYMLKKIVLPFSFSFLICLNYILFIIFPSCFPLTDSEALPQSFEDHLHYVGNLH